MFRNVSVRYYISSFFILLSLTAYSAEPPAKHDGKGTDGRGASTDRDPRFNSIEKNFEAATKDDAGDVKPVFKPVTGTDFKDKITLKPADMKVLHQFVKDAQDFRNNLDVCVAEKKDKNAHGVELVKLIDHCVKDQFAPMFLEEKVDGGVSSFKLKQNKDIAIGERELVQCRISLENIFNARETAKVADLQLQKDLLTSFDKMIEKFQWEKRDKKGIRKIDIKDAKMLADLNDAAKQSDGQKKTLEIEKAAKDNAPSADACTAKKKDSASPSPTPTTTPETTDAGAGAGTGDSDEARRREEEKDPPKLNPTIRTGTPGDPAKGGAGGGQPQPTPPPAQAFQPTPGLGQGIDPSLQNPFNNPFGFDPNALLDAITRPDGARIGGTGGSPSKTGGSPSNTSPSPPSLGSPSGGGGNDSKNPNEGLDKNQMPNPPPFTAPQQPPVIINGDNGAKAKDDVKPEKATSPRPEKEDINKSGRNAYDQGFQSGLRAGQQAGQYANARPGGNATRQKLGSSARRRGGRNGARSRQSNSRRYQTSAFTGSGKDFQTVNRAGQSRRTPNSSVSGGGNVGRGMPGTP